MFHPVILFLFGTCLGSFLNVVILRSIKSIQEDRPSFSINGRSYCPVCQRPLRWWELIPILSFIWLRGRCDRCGQPIAVQYPMVELGMGLLVMVMATPPPASLVDTMTLLLHISIAALLLVLFIIDLKTMLLPDSFVGLLAVVVVLDQLVRMQNLEFRIQNAVLGITIGAGFLLMLWIVTKGKGIGLGDVKLMIPLGLFLGPVSTLTLLLLAYTVGGVIAIYLLSQKRATLKTALPFGPFLCGAALLLLLFPTLPERFATLLLGYNPFV